MFQVRWARSARDELTAIWVDAGSDERRAITAATDRIDRILAQDPQLVGESRSADTRIAFVPPLVMHFSVDLVRQVVRVLRIVRYGRA